MSYTIQVSEVLEPYANVLYKMIKLRVTSTANPFLNRAMPEVLKVTDGSNSVNAFIVAILGNQLQVDAFFTVDAFNGYSSNVTVEFGYGNDYFITIPSVNINNRPPSPPYIDAIPHQLATNAWLQTLL